jgi:hypothetical protein
MHQRRGRIDELLIAPAGEAPHLHLPLDFDAGLLPLDLGIADESRLVVQHVKRGSVAGTLRYVELFDGGKLVERRMGLELGADVIVENSFTRMIEAYESWQNEAAHYGGASLRSRDESALLRLAGLYSSERLRRLLTGRVASHRRLAVLGGAISRGLLSDPAWS